MSFDWATFGLQLLNILILLAILRHFLFRPVAAIIAQRQAQAQALLDEAAAARAAAEAATAAAQAEAQATVRARAEVLTATQQQAASEHAATLEAAHAEAARIIAEARKTRAAEASAEAARGLSRARDLASDIAARALAAQPADIAGYLTRLSAALAAMPAPERSALLTGGSLRLLSAASLSDSDLAAARVAFAAYGVDPAPATDPALIAGLELRSDSGAVRNSLAHDLDRIARAMRDA